MVHHTDLYNPFFLILLSHLFIKGFPCHNHLSLQVILFKKTSNSCKLLGRRRYALDDRHSSTEVD